MSFSGLAANQTISYTNLQDAVTNGVFTLTSTITTSGRESTKSYIAAHVSGFPTNYPPYANKASNQLIVKGDIYNTGSFTIKGGYGVSFTTSLTGTNLPTFTFPISTTQTVNYSKQIPAQTFNGRISGTIGTNSIALYVDGILVDTIPGTDISGGIFSLTFPNSVNPPSNILMQLNSGTTPVPPVAPTGSTFTGRCFSTVCVNRGSGQYMVMGNANLYQYSSENWIAGYIYYSSNYGASWLQSTTFGYWSKISSSDDGKYVVAVEAYGKAYLSTDYGATYNPIAYLGTNSFTGVAISSTGQYQMVTTASNSGSNVYFSSSYGSVGTWSSVKSSSSEYYFTCAMDSSASNLLVGAGTINATIANGGSPIVYKSTNTGSTWSNVGIASWLGSLVDINIYASGGYAIAANTGASSTGTVSPLFLSGNGGTTWTAITGGSSPYRQWYRVVIPNQTPTAAYAITYTDNASTSYIQKVTSLYVGPSISNLTSAGNRSWHSLAVSDSGTYILAGATTGVWLSTNGGSTFTQL